MRLILLGAPGAGKGTQAVVLAQALGVPHISTGDIFRANIKNNTPLGIKAKEYIDKGALVPDEVTIDIVRDRLKQPDCSKGFILDGFPRTIPQAEYLEDVLKGIGTTVDHVIDINVPDEVIIKRLSGRRVCSSCSATYHNVNNPTKEEGICDACKAPTIQREDDREETIVKRLSTYHEQTEPLIEYYKGKGKLLTIDGTGTIEDGTKKLLKSLDVK